MPEFTKIFQLSIASFNYWWNTMYTYFTWRDIMSSTAISASAVAIAASAQHDANTAVCKQTLSSFDPDGASVAAMQAYANCVDLIHPEDMTDGVRMFIKISIVFFLAGVIGGWIYLRSSGEDFVGCTLMSIVFGIALGLIPSVIAAIGLAVGFLFS